MEQKGDQKNQHRLYNPLYLTSFTVHLNEKMLFLFWTMAKFNLKWDIFFKSICFNPNKMIVGLKGFWWGTPSVSSSCSRVYSSHPFIPQIDFISLQESSSCCRPDTVFVFLFFCHAGGCWHLYYGMLFEASAQNSFSVLPSRLPAAAVSLQRLHGSCCPWADAACSRWTAPQTRHRLGIISKWRTKCSFEVRNARLSLFSLWKRLTPLLSWCQSLISQTLPWRPENRL